MTGSLRSPGLFWLLVGVFFLYLFAVDPLLDARLFLTKLGSGGLHIRTHTLINVTVFF